MSTFLCLLGALVASAVLFFMGLRSGFKMGVNYCTQQLMILHKQHQKEKSDGSEI